MLASLAVMAAYSPITVAILSRIGRARQLRANKLAVATSLIFFSCSVGHGIHAVMTYRAIVQATGTGHGHVTADDCFWAAAVWDVFTASIGAYYWTLRRAYGVLLGKGAI